MAISGASAGGKRKRLASTDWVTVIAKEAKTSPLVRVREVASRYHRSLSATGQALQRQERRKLLEKITDGAYVNKLAAGVSPREICNVLVPESYISLATAMAEWGVSTQNPAATTCVTALRGRKIRTSSVNIVYRKISRDLFWGYARKKGRYNAYNIAEPEKAFLDWIYFRLKDGLPVELDEIRFEKLSRSRMVSYAKKYPATVMQALFFPLLDGQIAGLKP